MISIFFTICCVLFYIGLVIERSLFMVVVSAILAIFLIILADFFENKNEERIKKLERKIKKLEELVGEDNAKEKE
jgi:hypothetical protein